MELGDNASGLVIIRSLTLNGNGLQPLCGDPAYGNFYGVYTEGKSLQMEQTTIQNITNTDPSVLPAPGCVETSSALYANATTPGARTLTVDSSLFENFLKYGATVSGEVWTANLQSLSVTGNNGPRTQTGIALGDNPLGADATPGNITLSNSSVSGLLYSGYDPLSPDNLSVGILYKKDPLLSKNVTLSSNTIDDADAGALLEGQVSNVPGTLSLFSGNTVSGQYRHGVIVNGGLAGVTGNTFLPDSGTRKAISLWAQNGTAPDLLVRGNNFRNGGAGQTALEVQTDAPLNTAGTINIEAEENSWPGYSPVYKREGTSVVPIINTNANWWGCNTGPGAGCADAGDATPTSWLQLVLRARPSKILLPGGTSIISAELKDTGGTGTGELAANFPDATVDPLVVSPIGTLADSSLLLQDGEASTTLTRGADETGIATITGTLGAATSNLEVGFWQALDNTVAPQITGSGIVGQELSVSPGTWTGNPAPTFTYVWQAAPTASGPWQSISGATATTYTPLPEQAGQFLRVRVLASSPAGNMTATTASLPVLQLAPSELLPPRIYGVPQVGNTLQSFPGIWTSRDNPALSYQWQRSTDGLVWENIAEATNSDYLVATEDFGTSLRLQVSAATPGGSQTASSAPVAVFSFALSAQKTVSGRPVSVGAGTVPVARLECNQGECQVESVRVSLRARKKNVPGGSIVFETGTWSDGEKILSLQAPDALLSRLGVRKSGLVTLTVKISSSNGSILERDMRLGLRL